MKKIIDVLMILVMCMTLVSCASMSKDQKGAIIGAGTGGVVGGLIGKAAGNTAIGAIVGAAVGGIAGAYIGDYMDKQAKEMRKDIAGAKIERVGEGIKITFDSGLLFEVNKSTLSNTSKSNLTNLADILNKYEDTDILLEGHTDASGSDAYNLELSKKRATSVSNFLTTKKVVVKRFTVQGYGEAQPIASNETVDGRQQNRRVEVAIFANEELKKVAKKQAG